MKIPITFRKLYSSDIEQERGQRQLNRLILIVDVLYALTLYKLFLLLPGLELENLTRENLVQTLKDSAGNYQLMIVGFIMILMYWGQHNLQTGNLRRTDATHAVLSLVQVFCLYIYLYFMGLDMEFGAVIALQMESVFLTLAGVLSLLAWHYAKVNNFLSTKMNDDEKRNMFIKLLPEPIVSLSTLPFATLGAGVWSLSWLLIVPVSWLIKKYADRSKTNSGDQGTMRLQASEYTEIINQLNTL